MESLYRRHRFPPEIISHAVWLYHRFTLSFRDAEDLLAERGITVSYKAIRSWCRKFGPGASRAYLTSQPATGRRSASRLPHCGIRKRPTTSRSQTTLGRNLRMAVHSCWLRHLHGSGPQRGWTLPGQLVALAVTEFFVPVLDDMDRRPFRSNVFHVLDDDESLSVGGDVVPIEAIAETWNLLVCVLQNSP